MWFKYFSNFTLLIGTLLDISSTVNAAAMELRNNNITLSNIKQEM